MRLLWVFVDGLGLGPADPERNPVARARLPALDFLFGRGAFFLHSGPAAGAGSEDVRTAGGTGVRLRISPRGAVKPADACLGVKGLPQSATGQTSLFTGKNGPAAVGRHLRAYPSPTMKRLLAEHSVFARLARAGRRVTFLNAFSPDYVARLEAGAVRPSASTLAFRAAGTPLRNLDDLDAGRAVAFDITGDALLRRGIAVRVRTPGEAGRAAAAVAAEHDVILFEYFLTDLAGHAQDRAAAVQALERLDGFVGGALDAVRGPAWLLLASDHGNVEDLSTRGHTTNAVPVALAGLGSNGGAAAGALLNGVGTIADVAGLVERAVGAEAD